MRSNIAVGWFFPCNATGKCKTLTFSLQKNKISDSTLAQAVSSLLNSDSMGVESGGGGRGDASPAVKKSAGDAPQKL